MYVILNKKICCQVGVFYFVLSIYASTVLIAMYLILYQHRFFLLKRNTEEQTANFITCFSLASCKTIFLQIFIILQICLKFKIWSFLCLLLYQNLVVQLSSFNKSKHHQYRQKDGMTKSHGTRKKYMLALQRGN